MCGCFFLCFTRECCCQQATVASTVDTPHLRMCCLYCRACQRRQSVLVQSGRSVLRGDTHAPTVAGFALVPVERLALPVCDTLAAVALGAGEIPTTPSSAWLKARSESSVGSLALALRLSLSFFLLPTMMSVAAPTCVYACRSLTPTDCGCVVCGGCPR
jgi:hypothetical protein